MKTELVDPGVVSPANPAGCVHMNLTRISVFLKQSVARWFNFIFRLRPSKEWIAMSAHRKFILHIEDDEDDRAMLKDAVKQCAPSLDVWSAGNGQEGLEVLNQCTLLNELPQLIILDLNLPGMDGKSVLQEIKKHSMLSVIPVVIFTTSSNQMDKIFSAREGVKIYTKPSVSVRQTHLRYSRSYCVKKEKDFNWYPSDKPIYVTRGVTA